jgi:hypothetical protein
LCAGFSFRLRRSYAATGPTTQNLHRDKADFVLRAWGLGLRSSSYDPTSRSMATTPQDDWTRQPNILGRQLNANNNQPEAIKILSLGTILKKDIQRMLDVLFYVIRSNVFFRDPNDTASSSANHKKVN